MNRIQHIFEYRQMIFSLVQRELRGRYKGSVLGFLWTFVNPLLQLVVYTLVFSVILRSDIDHYYIFLFVGLVPWLFFSSCLSGGASCIRGQQSLVCKIYFPREVIPISFVTTAFVNMLLTFIVVFAVLLISGFGVNFAILWYLVPVAIVEYLLCLGMTMLFSALTVYFRDLEHILGIVTMAWQFLTPVMYSYERAIKSLSEKPILLMFWNLNPMTPVITGYRQILYYKAAPDLQTLLSAIGIGFGFLLIGWFSFNHLQKGFAEEM